MRFWCARTKSSHISTYWSKARSGLSAPWKSRISTIGLESPVQAGSRRRSRAKYFSRSRKWSTPKYSAKKNVSTTLIAMRFRSWQLLPTRALYWYIGRTWRKRWQIKKKSGCSSWQRLVSQESILLNKKSRLSNLSRELRKKPSWMA